ncbi:phage tail protein [Ligilactobacillus faecis]|uniref:phage tail protein n=1 Tax=Ligilactobacillus faecis TaxID=762833 RepID=UPI002469531A|nr:phage tail protein [Ligilactobacillus faecis]WGN89042.1 phage tail protein [Ligilactobacillus faecis]
MDILKALQNNKFVYFGFDPSGETKNDPWRALPNISISSDAKNWSSVLNFPKLEGLRDGFICRVGDVYYLLGTLAMYKTSDFKVFEALNIDLIKQASGYTDIWAPEMFVDKEGKYHIVYSATKNGQRGIYVADFDVITDKVSNAYQTVDVDVKSSIDPNVTYLDGKYYLWLSSARLFVSDNYLGHYTEVATNIINDPSAKWYEAPEMLVAGDYLYLYQDKIDSHVEGVSDSGYMVYRRAKRINPIIWSDERPVKGSFNMRHGSFLYNDTIFVREPTYELPTSNFDEVVTVKAIGIEQTMPLNCILWSTFAVQWAQNSTYQLTFTAFDDGSASFKMLLSAESIVTFDDQQYVVKQVAPNLQGSTSQVQITATHIYNDIARVRQYDTRNGTLTYLPQDILEFYLGAKNNDNVGYTYSVYGSFDKQQIQNLGDSSGKDMLSKILSTWPSSIIYPNNKEIGVYSPEAFKKSFGQRIDYRNNTQDIKITIDSTNLSNKVKCFGKQKENSTDNAKVEYYFQPFFVEDEQSIKVWGVHPMDNISDERFTDKQNMENYARSQLQKEPIISLEVTASTNFKPIAGEVRHLTITENGFETDVTLIGYTWYPYNKTQATVLQYENLPASILNTQSLINNRINNINELAQKALNKATTATTTYYSKDDPTKYNMVRVGDIWVRPLDEGG